MVIDGRHVKLKIFDYIMKLPQSLMTSFQSDAAESEEYVRGTAVGVRFRRWIASSADRSWHGRRPEAGRRTQGVCSLAHDRTALESLRTEPQTARSSCGVPLRDARPGRSQALSQLHLLS